MSATRVADTEYLVRHSMIRGYQLFSLLTPPIYVTLILARRGKGAFSVNRLLRATWIGSAVGISGCGSFEYVRSAYSNEDTLRRRKLQTTHNIIDDHSAVGSILFAVLTPAIFWTRARLVHLILGGASIGSAVGIVTHYTRSLSGDESASVSHSIYR